MSGMKPYGFKTKKEGFIFMKKTVKKLAAVGLTLTSVTTRQQRVLLTDQ